MCAQSAEATVILVVEEDPRLRETLAAASDGNDVHLIRVQNEAEAVNCLDADRVSVLVAPMRSRSTDGAKLLRLAQARNPSVAVILTVEPNALDQDTAVRLMADGAYDFLTKPVNTDKLRAVIQRVLGQQALLRENEALHRQLTDTSALLGFTGKSPVMRAVYDRLIRLAAAPDTTVMICGESGTGKEVAARALHQHSSRRDGAFVPFNCAGLPESLLESELFGHEAGAFTGATRRRRGRFELAHGGTMVLDEIGEMSLPAQAKLLRVLESREFERIGGEKSLRVDVRLIAITNRDLGDEVLRGNFRADLYHRLRVATVNMPALRERTGDVPLLAHAFVDEFNKEMGRSIEGIAPGAMRVLERYPWYGNVRELKNCVEAMFVVTQNRVLEEVDLPDWIVSHNGSDPTARIRDNKAIAAPTANRRYGSGSDEDAAFADERAAEGQPIPVKAGMSLSEIEREAIRATLELTDGNKAQAARVLGIGRRTLFRKVKEYDLG